MIKLEKIVTEFVKSESKKYKFRLRLDDSYLAKWKNKEYSSGYFNAPEFSGDKTALLAIGTKKETKLWIPVLLHEYCHFTQWNEKCKIWKEYSRLTLKKKKNDKDKKKLYQVTMHLEADCEHRTINLIKKLKLEKYIDLKKYAQCANAYITFYHVYVKTGKWYQKAPFDIKDILKYMPTKIKKPNKLKPSKELMGLYIEKCYKNEYKEI